MRYPTKSSLKKAVRVPRELQRANKRLLRLARYLEELDDRRRLDKSIPAFDMSVFFTKDEPVGPIKKPPYMLDCSTSACALGHAAHSGIFARDGLGIEIVKPGASRWFSAIPLLDGKKMPWLEMAARLFSLRRNETWSDGRMLYEVMFFESRLYKQETPRSVASAIRRVVMRRESDLGVRNWLATERLFNEY